MKQKESLGRRRNHLRSRVYFILGMLGMRPCDVHSIPITRAPLLMVGPIGRRSVATIDHLAVLLLLLMDQSTCNLRHCNCTAY